MRILIGLLSLAMLATNLALIGLLLCAGGAVAYVLASMLGAPSWLATGIGFWIPIYFASGILFGDMRQVATWDDR